MIPAPQKNSRRQGIHLDRSDGAGFRSEDSADVGSRPGRVIRKFFANPGRRRSKRDQVAPRNGPAGKSIRVAFEDIESTVPGEITIIDSDRLFRTRLVIGTV